jgi:hypothetical protein
MYNSFRIAEWLNSSYADAPSLFTGDGKPSRDAQSEHLATGKNYARLIDLVRMAIRNYLHSIAKNSYVEPR